MVRVKSSNVKLALAQEPIARMVRVLTELAVDLEGRGLWTGDLVITSGNDSRHGANSRHYVDEAIDVRSHNFASRAAKREFRATFEAALGPQFRVLLECEGTANEHFHAQVRKGHVYRPTVPAVMEVFGRLSATSL